MIKTMRWLQSFNHWCSGPWQKRSASFQLESSEGLGDLGPGNLAVHTRETSEAFKDGSKPGSPALGMRILAEAWRCGKPEQGVGSNSCREIGIMQAFPALSASLWAAAPCSNAKDKPSSYCLHLTTCSWIPRRHCHIAPLSLMVDHVLSSDGEIHFYTSALCSAGCRKI
jgi:hypothetical protein